MKWIADIHNHSSFSFDSEAPLEEMLAAAQRQGVAFYGEAEHFDYEVEDNENPIDEEGYFHSARHLQEDYEGVMNVLVGAEFAYGAEPKVGGRYLTTYEKYKPDFVVNSVHTCKGCDYYYKTPFYKDGVLRDKKEVFLEYISLVEQSLDVAYPYDIVGHFGYATRYAPYEDKRMDIETFGEEIDRVLKKIIQKGKILEVNASSAGLSEPTVPSREILERYYKLGGRQVSYASDAHLPDSVLRNWTGVVALLKEIGFTYITVPSKGEYIKLEI